jgi:quercetin dioxygenase-like cupin family protein
MADTTSLPDQSAGQTSGSPQRPAHDVEASGALSLNAEIAALYRETAWQAGDRNAKTLVKEGDLRQVLTVLKPGAVLREHQVPGTAAIQVLGGRLRVRTDGQMIDLTPGMLLTLAADAPHDAEALDEAAFLITIAWRGGPRGDVASH